MIELERITPDGSFVEFTGKCHRCGNTDHFAYYPNGPHIAAYCGYCGQFLRFCRKTDNLRQDWVREIKERDGYTCQRCGERLTGRQAEAHHLLPVWFMPERRFELRNGICLCKKCHKQLHGSGGTINEKD